MDWEPKDYAENARFVSDLGVDVIKLLAPRRGERILDLGCGDGALTQELSRYSCDVLGIDSSPAMVAAAESRGIDAAVADGANLEFRGEFDAVFSNAAIHWMGSLDAVVAGVQRALKPGCRFVGEFGGYGNVAVILGAVEQVLVSRGLEFTNPWCFPTKRLFLDVLERHGFTVNFAELFPRPTQLPGDVRGWLRTFGAPLFSELDEDERSSVVNEVFDLLGRSIVDDQGCWIADYVRLRFGAIKI